MTTLRTFCMFVLVLCAGVCAAESRPAPEPDPDPQANTGADDGAEDECPDLFLPFYLDLTYRWLTDTRGRNRHRGTTLFQIGFGELAGVDTLDWQRHRLLFDATVEAGHGFTRNPTSLRVSAGYAFDGDSGFTGPLMIGGPSAYHAPFPSARMALTAFGLGMTVGYQHDWFAPGPGGAGRQRDAIRVQNWAFVSPAILEVRVEFAIALDLADFELEPEVGVILKFGRPVLPFALHIGWTWIGEGDAGRHYLTTGVTVAF